ncbi:hypothetical protein BLNAU_5040 [Blattamonas nauphoetae]|uniref:Uncharacterized protein n=1 Tax=Blattamonas nauphoetae TaxID=2049346 RepID=A0ABQ9Y8V7_9EUKA|nr:hypothetical protein BLNAU_5040 [Blattamonas nauphoetae]
MSSVLRNLTEEDQFCEGNDRRVLHRSTVSVSSSFVPKDMSADGYWEEDGKNTANANTLLFSSLVRRIPPNHIMLLLLLDE